MSLKIGVVGTGNVAKRNYLPCLADQEDVSLGYFNRTRSKAESVAAEFDGRVFDSLDEMAGWTPDAIFVLTKETDRLYAANALLAHSPKRLFFEKPLTARHGQQDVTEEDFLGARAMLQTAASKNCETAMVFNYRFFGQYARAREIATERSFGRVFNVCGLVHYACWSHAIDLVHYFADPVIQLTALQSEQERGGNTGGRDVTAAFRTQTDGTGTLIGTSALAWEYPLFELTFNYERGRLRLRDLDGDLEIMETGNGRHEIHALSRDRSRWDQYSDSFAASTLAYLETVRAGEAPPIPGTAGLRELQVEAAIKRSVALGRPVDLAAELPLEP